MMLLLGTAMFAVFFFLTIFIQTVWGYSPVKAGVAWVPFPIMMIAINIFVARVLVTKVGVRPLLWPGRCSPASASCCCRGCRRPAATGSTCWGRWRVLSIGMGLMFVPLTLMVVSHVRHDERVPPPACLTWAADRRLHRPGRHRHDRLDFGREHRARLHGRSRGERRLQGASAAGGADAAAGIPPAMFYHGAPVGFSTGLMIAGLRHALSGFVVAIVTTWTPGRFRLRSARHDQDAVVRRRARHLRGSHGAATNAATPLSRREERGGRPWPPRPVSRPPPPCGVAGSPPFRPRLRPAPRASSSPASSSRSSSAG